jgi:hypothetical protein
MNRARNIALIVGTIVTFGVFGWAVYSLMFGGRFGTHEALIYLALALAPAAMVSVMIGYAFWWLIVFIAGLLMSGDSPGPEDS